MVIKINITSARGTGPTSQTVAVGAGFWRLPAISATSAGEKVAARQLDGNGLTTKYTAALQYWQLERPHQDLTIEHHSFVTHTGTSVTASSMWCTAPSICLSKDTHTHMLLRVSQLLYPPSVFRPTSLHAQNLSRQPASVLQPLAPRLPTSQQGTYLHPWQSESLSCQADCYWNISRVASTKVSHPGSSWQLLVCLLEHYLGRAVYLHPLKDWTINIVSQ